MGTDLFSVGLMGETFGQVLATILPPWHLHLMPETSERPVGTAGGRSRP